jgi:hypothetical protein
MLPDNEHDALRLTTRKLINDTRLYLATLRRNQELTNRDIATAEKQLQEAQECLRGLNELIGD